MVSNLWNALRSEWIPQYSLPDGSILAIYQILRTAFPFMTFGMLGGALWAKAAWGRYAIYFHTRKSPWSKWADLPHLLAFLALLTTFFLVNLLPKLGSLLHSYA